MIIKEYTGLERGLSSVAFSKDLSSVPTSHVREALGAGELLSLMQVTPTTPAVVKDEEKS